MKNSINKEYEKIDETNAIELVKEYSEKLRVICENKRKIDYKRKMLKTISIVLSIGILMLGIPFSLVTFETNHFRFAFVGALIGYVIAINFIPFVNYRRDKYQPDTYEAHQIARITEMLVHRISQYREHASYEFLDSLEIDIRMAEAEASLIMYKEIFRQGNDEVVGVAKAGIGAYDGNVRMHK